MTNAAHTEPVGGSLAEAVKLYGRGDFHGCERAAAALSPSPSAFLLRGAAIFSLGLRKEQEEAARVKRETGSGDQGEKAGRALFKEALDLNLKALELDPNMCEALSNAGNCHRALGDTEQALSFYFKALEEKPQFQDALVNVAGVYSFRGQISDAISYMHRADAAGPSVDTKIHLGILYRSAGLLPNAHQAFQAATSMDPQRASSWTRLGTVYRELGRPQDALSCFERSIQLDASPEALMGAAASLRALRRPEEAVRCAERAAAMGGPTEVSALAAAGDALTEAGRCDDAIATYRKALSIHPDSPDLLNNVCPLYSASPAQSRSTHATPPLTTTWAALNICPTFAIVHSNVQEAMRHFATALALDPYFADAHANLGHAYKLAGRCLEWDRARAGGAGGAGGTGRGRGRGPGGVCKCYGKAMTLRPDWADPVAAVGAALKELGRHLQAIAYLRRALLLKPDHPDSLANLAHAEQASCAWGEFERNVRRLLQVVSRQPRGRRAGGGAARVVDLLPRATPAPLRIRLTAPRAPRAVACVQPHHALFYPIPNAWIEAEAEHFVDLIAVPSPAAAHRIREVDKIHVLFNLNGYTARARNEASSRSRSGPRPGFPGSMGAPKYMPFMLADDVVIPPELEDRYDERILRIPAPFSYFVTDHAQSFRDVLAGGRTRAQAPPPPLARPVPPLAPDFVRAPGSAASLILTESGHTTGADVLWAGCPLLTLPGRPMHSRVGASLLRALGMDRELVAASMEEYEERAVYLATAGRGELASLRARLAERRATSPLFDTRGWVQRLETLVQDLWRQQLPGLLSAAAAAAAAAAEGVQGAQAAHGAGPDGEEGATDAEESSSSSTLLGLGLAAGDGPPAPHSLPCA
eukprot:tig00020553_g10665.t1